VVVVGAADVVVGNVELVGGALLGVPLVLHAASRATAAIATMPVDKAFIIPHSRVAKAAPG